MSLKDQFTSAKAYVQAKDYQNARRVLRRIDHPKAREWLQRINKLDPTAVRRKRVIIALILALILLVGSFWLLSYTSSQQTQVFSDQLATAQAINRLK